MDGGVCDEGRFCRLSDDFLYAVLILFHLRITAKRHACCEYILVVTCIVYDRHFILGERTRFIRANNLSAAESLYSGKSPNDGISVRHLGNSHGEHYGNYGYEALRDCGYRKGYSEHEGVYHDVHAEASFSYNAENEYEYADSEHELGENLGELSELDLKRSHLFLCLRDRIGNLTHLGLHACSRDYHAGASVYYGASHIEHVLSVCERDVLGVCCYV